MCQAEQKLPCSYYPTMMTCREELSCENFDVAIVTGKNERHLKFCIGSSVDLKFLMQQCQNAI